MGILVDSLFLPRLGEFNKVTGSIRTSGLLAKIVSIETSYFIIGSFLKDLLDRNAFTLACQYKLKI